MASIPGFAFEAAGQAAGYYYQLRYALLRALEQIRKDPTGSVSVEKLDDISLWNASSPEEIQQLKHTTNSSTTFSDASPQVWRTLANWATLLATPALATSRVRLVLVTNAQIGEGSALLKLGPDEHERDADAAIQLWMDAAKTSRNKDTQADRERFLALQEIERARLVQAITVLSDAPNLAGVGSELDEVLYYSCEADQLSELRQELEGWWLHRVASDLSTGTASTIALVELDGKVSFLRNKYKRSLLTIDVEHTDIDYDSLLDHVFIKQMWAVDVGSSRIRNAQRDFLRAGTQRSKWVRDLRLDPAELSRYDSELEDQWSAQYAILQDDLGTSADDQAKIKAGRTLLGWAETRQIPIKGAQAQFLTSGSYHTLADQVRVGWHPDFAAMFGGSDGAAKS